MRLPSMPLVLLSLLSGLPLVAHAQEAAQAVPGALVHVESSKPGTTVALVTGNAVGSGYSSSGGTVTVATTFYKDLCIAPCDVSVEPGLRELLFYSKGKLPVRYKGDFRVDQNTALLVKPASALLRYSMFIPMAAGISLSAIGMVPTTTVTNDGQIETTTHYPMLGGGLALLTGSLVSYFLIHSDVQQVSQPLAP